MPNENGIPLVGIKLANGEKSCEDIFEMPNSKEDDVLPFVY